MVAGLCPANRVSCVNNTTEGLNQRGLSDIKFAANRNGVDRRHCNEIREPAGQASDSMLAIKLALMRISRATIFTEVSAPQALTVQSLIDNHAVARFQIDYFAAERFNPAANFMTKD